MRRTALLVLWLGLLAPVGPSGAADVYNLELFDKARNGDAQALAKLTQLAESGDGPAQYDLGQYYLFKLQSLDEDMPRIIGWLQKSAEQGVNRAQLDLGVALGKAGFPWYDPVQSLMWFYVGMAVTLEQHPDGSQDHYAVFATNNAHRLSQSISKEQLRAAESLTRKWLDAHGIDAQKEGRNIEAFVKRYDARNGKH